MNVDAFSSHASSSPHSIVTGASPDSAFDSTYEWGSVPSHPTTPDWSVSPGASRPRNHGLSVAIPSNISFEPISNASPSQLFAGPQADSYESLYSGTNGWGAIMAAQSLYSSPSLDPLAHLNKGNPVMGTGFLSGTDYVNVKTAFPNVVLPSTTLALPVLDDLPMPPPPPVPQPKPVVAAAVQPARATAVAAAVPVPAKTAKAIPLSTAPSAAAAAAPSGTAGSKRKRGAPNEDAVAQRRRKHNEIEIRRRQRLNDNFDELQTLIQYEKKEKDKDSVLRFAIDRLLAYRSRVDELQRHLEQKQLVAIQRPISVLPPQGPSFNSKVNHNTVFSNNDVPMAVANLRGKLLDANERFCEIIGYNIEKLRQVPCVQLTHPDDIPELFESLKQLLGGAITSFTASRRMLTAARRYVHFSNTIWLVKESEVPKYIMGIFIPLSIGDPIPEALVPKSLPAPYAQAHLCTSHSLGPSEHTAADVPPVSTS